MQDHSHEKFLSTTLEESETIKGFQDRIRNYEDSIKEKQGNPSDLERIARFEKIIKYSSFSEDIKNFWIKHNCDPKIIRDQVQI